MTDVLFTPVVVVDGDDNRDSSLIPMTGLFRLCLQSPFHCHPVSSAYL